MSGDRRGDAGTISTSNKRSSAERLFDSRLFLHTEGTGRNRLSHPKGRKLFSQGDRADTLFYIETGKVKIAVVSSHGKEAVVSILAAGDFFGEGCLLSQTVRSATATTETDCEIMQISKKSMMRAVRQEPSFAELFIGHLLKRTVRAEEDLVDQLFNSSEKRLARALLLMANYDKDGHPEKILDPVSQETLADMVGTTRSRVSRFMNKFRELGFIDYGKDRLEIHSSLLNVVLGEAND